VSNKFQWQPIPRALASALLVFAATAGAADHPTLKLWPHGVPGETGAIGPERQLPKESNPAH